MSQSTSAPLLLLLPPDLFSSWSYKGIFAPASNSQCTGLEARRLGVDVRDDVGGIGIPVVPVVPRWCWREAEGGTGCEMGWRRWSIVYDVTSRVCRNLQKGDWELLISVGESMYCEQCHIKLLKTNIFPSIRDHISMLVTRRVQSRRVDWVLYYYYSPPGRTNRRQQGHISNWQRLEDGETSPEVMYTFSMCYAPIVHLQLACRWDLQATQMPIAAALSQA